MLFKLFPRPLLNLLDPSTAPHGPEFFTAPKLFLRPLLSIGAVTTATWQPCLALLYFASGSFKRVVALCGSVSYSACWWAIQRVTYALCRRKKRYIRMPSDLEMAATARRMYARFGLPRFALVPHGQFQEVLTRRTTSAASSSML
jgi:hypothetical protein